MNGHTPMLLVWLAAPGWAAAEPLPEGNAGIAASYPGDVGIGGDPAVIFADDFESYGSADDLTSRWDQAYHAEDLGIATEAENVFAGVQALEFVVPVQSEEVSNTVIKSVSPTRDALFVRFYARYGAGFDVLGSSHNGCSMSASYWDGPGSGPGIKADGYNKYMTSYEAGRFEDTIPNPGQLNLYIYHPDQRDIWGDHFFPTGLVSPYTAVPFDFGPDFVSRPDVVPPTGSWHCYEVMVKANTPGQRDGRIALWMDGVLIADFMNVRLRETTDLKIDTFSLDLHIKSNTRAVARKWYDNVVAATSYIGPVYEGTGDTTAPAAPGNLRVE